MGNDASKASASSKSLHRRLPACLSGEIWLQSKFLRRWKRRYMEIKGQSLTIRSCARGQTLHILNLADCRVEECPDIEAPQEFVLELSGSDNTPVVFSIHNSSVRDFYFCTSTNMAELWMAKITNRTSNQVALDDFAILQPIGKGGYGDVTLVEKKDDGKLYAMKRISKWIDYDEKKVVTPEKKQEMEQKHVQRVLEERAALEGLGRHAFVADLKYAFQTPDYWYLIQEYVEGTNLYKLARAVRQKRFPEKVVKMWAAELVSAISYMHSNNVTHRDLKPDNILIDTNGHVNVIDLGLSKNTDALTDTGKGRSKTVCGTKYYMSPEMVKGEAYSNMVDWWSLGVILYEILVGVLPFYSRDLRRQFLKIIQCDLIFPGERGRADTSPVELSDQCRDFLARLLAKDPKKRLGSNLHEIQQHPWFSGIDWQSINAKKGDTSKAKSYIAKYLATNPLRTKFRPSWDSYETGIDNIDVNQSDEFRIDGFSFVCSEETDLSAEEELTNQTQNLHIGSAPPASPRRVSRNGRLRIH